MRFFYSLIYFILIFFNASCQADTSFIPVAAYWEKGDEFHFKVTKVKQTWQDKNLTQDDSTEYIARFLVTDTDSSSYTIEWSFINTFFDLLGLPPESREKFPSYRNIIVVYTTDEFGAFTGIENWQEIGRMINDLADEFILLKSNNSKTTTEDLKKSLEPMLTVFSSKRGIEQLVFKELLMMHFPFGKQYERGKIYNYTEQVPIMVNSEPVTGSGIIFIRLANLDSQRCELVQRMKILPDSAKKMLRSHFHSIGMRPQAIPATIESSRVDVNEENFYDYYYYPGIPIKVSASRETQINVLEDNIKQTDITLIEWIE
jgi:hypothetical protein